MEQANYDHNFSGSDDQMEGDPLSDDEYEMPDEEEANNMTFRKSTTQVVTGGPDELLAGKKMNLRNIMDDPEQFGFDKSRIVNGQSVT